MGLKKGKPALLRSYFPSGCVFLLLSPRTSQLLLTLLEALVRQREGGERLGHWAVAA